MFLQGQCIYVYMKRQVELGVNGPRLAVGLYMCPRLGNTVLSVPCNETAWVCGTDLGGHHSTDSDEIVRDDTGNAGNCAI